VIAVYMLSVVVSLVVLAVALRPRRATVPTPPPAPPAPACRSTAAAEVHVILAAAHQLAARLDTAA
jgi:hypothetical protein